MSGYDTTPKAGLLLAMQNQKWHVAGALSELVDNAFGPGRGNASECHISHSIGDRTIAVFDNGQGMESLGRLFQLGNTIGHTPGDIGIYGSGGTMALLWLAHKVDVWTMSEGRVSYDSVDWAWHIKKDVFPVVSNSWEKATLANTPAPLFEAGHGTLIRLHLLRSRSILPGNIRRDLAKNYAPALRMGRQLLWTSIARGGNTTTDAINDPLPMPQDPSKRVAANVVVEVDGQQHLPVRIMVGLFDGLTQDRSHIAVSYGCRVITRTRDCYSSPDGAERFGGVGVAGWIELGDGWQPYLATTKDAIHDDSAWKALMAYIFQQIQVLLRQVDEEKLSIELQDIGISLERVFNGKVKIEVPSAAARREREKREKLEKPEHPESEKPEPEAKRERPMPPPGETDGSASKRAENAVTRLDLLPCTDAEMHGLLCRADPSRDGVDVFINSGHVAVKQAMVQRPINRLALHMMVTAHIAATVVRTPGLIEKCFRPYVVRDIELIDEDQREGMVMRMLMDSIRHEDVS
jgi:hypothetical protein